MLLIIQLWLLTVEFKLTFLNAVMDLFSWHRLSEVFLSPCCTVSCICCLRCQWSWTFNVAFRPGPLCTEIYSKFSESSDITDVRRWNLQILCNHILRSIVCKMLDCLSTQSFTKSRTLRHHCIRTTNPLRNLFLSLPEPFFLEHASGITFRKCLHFQKTVKLRNLEIEYTVFVFVLHSVEDKWIKGLKRFANVLKSVFFYSHLQNITVFLDMGFTISERKMS